MSVGGARPTTCVVIGYLARPIASVAQLWRSARPGECVEKFIAPLCPALQKAEVRLILAANQIRGNCVEGEGVGQPGFLDDGSSALRQDTAPYENSLLT